MSERDTLIAEAEIGEEGRRFLASDLGRSILGCNDQELDKTLDEFEIADVTDAKVMARLQNEVRCHRRFMRWIEERIAAGEDALVQWKANQRKD